MAILLTGGAGYIGSHIAVELLQLDKEVVIVDNFENSSIKVIDRIENITNKKPMVYQGDIRDKEFLDKMFLSEEIETVIHLAGLKAVGESVKKPLEYYDNNVNGTLVLLEEMRKHNIKNIIFSSSATVYGEENPIPYLESYKRGRPSSPYGWTKSMIEQILEDTHKADEQWNVVILRYFNPIGAHPTGLIGEDPKGIPNNLAPYITQVAVGKLEKLGIFGDDYPTNDGTGVRDYIHVVDLAKGHVAALDKAREGQGLSIYNLGRGQGSSVFEVLRAYEKAVGKEIPFIVKPRRQGDLPEFYCDASKAKEDLNWQAEYDLETMAKDSWNWQKNNPEGY